MKLKPFLDLVKATFQEWWEDNTFRLAASLAFYTVFSLAPIMVISLSIAEAVYERDKARRQLLRQVAQMVGDEGAVAVEQVLDSARKTDGGPFAVAFGIGMLIIGSTVVFAELQAALNQIWDVKTDARRGVVWSLVRARLLSFGLAVAVGFLLLVSLVLSAMLNGARETLDEWMPGLPWLWQIAHALVSFVVISLLFAMIYKYLPDVRLTWRDVAVGAAVSAALFSVGKVLIGLYLGRMAIGNSYGAAGSFAVLLIWVYYSALISFFGAEFTQVFARRYGSRIQPEEHAVRVGEKPDAV